MSFTIQGTSHLSFSRNISDEKIDSITSANSKEEATHMGVWDKIKDWFCGTNEKAVRSYIYDLTHNNPAYNEMNPNTKFYDQNHDNQSLSTETVFGKMSSFYQLKAMAGDGYKHKFKAEIINNEDGTHTFKFSIDDALKETNIKYGEFEKDRDLFTKRELTNSNQFLDQQNVTNNGVEAALKKVVYTDTNQLAGISAANQQRLGMDLLSEQTKQTMLTDNDRTQEWIELQMKSFDYYTDLYCSMTATIAEAGLSSGNGLSSEDGQFIANITGSIETMKKNATQCLATAFNSVNLLSQVNTDRNSLQRTSNVSM